MKNSGPLVIALILFAVDDDVTAGDDVADVRWELYLIERDHPYTLLIACYAAGGTRTTRSLDKKPNWLGVKQPLLQTSASQGEQADQENPFYGYGNYFSVRAEFVNTSKR